MTPIVRHLTHYIPSPDTSQRARWLAHRRQGIAGTDVAAIAGLHPYKSAWSVYWEKLGEDPLEPDPNEAMEWGRRLEAEVVDAWALRMAQTNVPVTTSTPGLMRHPKRSWQIGTPDRLVHHGAWRASALHAPPEQRSPIDVLPRDAHPEVLEVKTVSEMAWEHQWDDGNTIPVWHLAQAHWYADIVGCRRIWFAVLVGGRRLEGFYTELQPDLIEHLRDAAEEFWALLVAGTPPSPDGSERTRERLARLYPARDTTTVQLPPEAEAVIRAYRTARSHVTRYKAIQDEAANRLIGLLGQLQATDGYIGDRLAVTYRRRTAVDTDAVAKDWPDAVAAATRTVVSIEALTGKLGRQALAAYRQPTDDRSIRVLED